MRGIVPIGFLTALALTVAACGGEPGSGSSPTPSATGGPSATAAPSPSPTTDPSPSVTPAPSPTAGPSPSPTDTAGPCDPAAVRATIASAVVAARLAPVTAWADDASGSPLAERTTTGDVFAERLGLDCGLLAAEDLGGGDERLVLAAWTGTRMAWVVQTTESPTTPYAPDATVTVLVDVAAGEFLDGDARSVWAGTMTDDVTFVIGHADFNLGAAAKGWLVEEPPVDDELATLAAERHAIRALESAGMREVGVAEPAQIGSEEGHVMFVSTTGQISVADVAPTGWFDPMVPRYYTGTTRVETIDGVPVRITAPGPDDAMDVAAEVGFACDGFVWLLEPPLNGTADEAVASAAAVLGTPECRAGA